MTKELVILEVFHKGKWLGYVGRKKKDKWPIETDSLKARAVRKGKPADTLANQFREFMKEQGMDGDLKVEFLSVPK